MTTLVAVYNNLYAHFVVTTLHRMPLISEKVSLANPEHVHFLVSRYPQLVEESLATIVANSSDCANT